MRRAVDPFWVDPLLEVRQFDESNPAEESKALPSVVTPKALDRQAFPACAHCSEVKVP